MQIDKKDYNAELHDVYKALTVKQPFADLLTKVTGRDAEGQFTADKTIEVRSRATKYRGDLLICSSAKPEIPGRMSGVVCGFVEVYDCKPVEDFTEADWEATCLPDAERAKTHKGWGWFVRNPRRVVEMPIKGKLGLYDLIVPKDDITIYPQHFAFGEYGWEAIKKKIK